MFFLGEVVRAGINATSKLREFQVRMLGAEGEDPNAGLADGVQSLEPPGIATNPAAGSSLRTLMVQIGNQLISIATWNKSKRPTDLESNETRVYGLDKIAAALRILATGKILLTAESGQDIVFNGGTAKVAREGDSVNAGTITAVAGAVTVNFVYTPVGGTAGTASPTLLLTGGKITSGAANVKS